MVRVSFFFFKKEQFTILGITPSGVRVKRKNSLNFYKAGPTAIHSGPKAHGGTPWRH
jgi:hypothetical protein